MAILSAALLGCTGNAYHDNPLIGRWHLVSWKKNTNPNWLAPVCATNDITFTPTDATDFNKSEHETVAVTYNVQPTKVVVSSANDVIYWLIDTDHIRQDGTGECTYRRDP